MLDQLQKTTALAFWNVNNANPKAIFAGMDLYSVSIPEMASAIGTTPEFVYWYARYYGQPEGWGKFIADKPPVWQDFYVNWNNSHVATYGVSFNRAWTADPDSVYAKIAIDKGYRIALDWFNKNKKKQYAPLPPTWLDTYINWLTNGYFQAYNDVINRPWNSDQDSINQKLILDQMYQNDLTAYNAKWKTDFHANPAELGPDAQLNTYNANHTGGIGILGIILIVAVIAVCVFLPEIIAYVGDMFSGSAVVTQGVVATGAEGLVPLTATTVPSSLVTGVTATQTGGLTLSTITGYVSTANQYVSGAKLIVKVANGQPVSGLEILQGASIVSGIGSSIGSNFALKGVSTMDLTVTDVSDMGGGTYQYTYSDGSSQIVDSSGTTSTYDPNGAFVPNMSTLQAVGVEPNPDGTYTYTFNDGSTSTVNSDGSIVAATNQYQQPIDPRSTPNPVATSSSSWSWKDFDKTIQTVGNAVKTTVGVIASVRNMGNPPILRGSTSVSNGVTRTVNRNGTVTTRLANGTTKVTGLPTGQPFGFDDGSVVVNNGNGTFTTVNADGTSTNGSAPKMTGAGVSSTVLYAGLGIAAIMLLRK